MIKNNDFRIFQKEITWFLKPTSKVKYEEIDIRLSIEFRDTFPKLTSLIEKARFTVINVDHLEYLLFAWDKKENIVCGWLNKVEEVENYFCRLIPEHELLIRNIGGIVEAFNQPENSLSNNQNFIFLGNECSRGIGNWDYYYTMKCDDENCVQIDFSNFLAFAEEANGALTMYDPKTNKVLLFSHDHSFDNVNFMESQPHYTFHTFKGIGTFIDYVEELAIQWLEATK